jgi:uroporphyrinogen-III synthase
MADDRIPVLLLKTKSGLSDGYEEHFQSFKERGYVPDFIPVLEHRFREDALEEIRELIIQKAFAASSGASNSSRYGGIIFTSQRAVEAFTKVIAELRNFGLLPDNALPVSCFFYVVGPATARGLRTLKLPCPIVGEESGNGDALAQFILSHYNEQYPPDSGKQKPALLFLVGEQRRDIIPKTLQSENLDPAQRTQVDEVVVYETGEMDSFRSSFAQTWAQNLEDGYLRQWVVIFSPTGCRALLELWGLIDPDTGRVKTDNKRVQDRRASVTAPESQPRTFIATIGPTTKDYLVREFGFEPDVVAPKPSPEGLLEGIEEFMKHLDT